MLPGWGASGNQAAWLQALIGASGAGAQGGFPVCGKSRYHPRTVAVVGLAVPLGKFQWYLFIGNTCRRFKRLPVSGQ